MVFKLSEVLTSLSKREGNTVNLFFFFAKSVTFSLWRLNAT